jgi:MFS family permease
VSRAPGRTFRSLHIRNYRIYFFGQLVSQAGTFMQAVAQSWLVLKLTGSGTALGFVTMLQYLPLLVFGGMAGVLIDRMDRRRLYAITQAISGLLALALGILVATHSVQLWMVYALALCLGLVAAVDQPIRQTFIFDLVGPDELSNAVSLQVSLSSTSRAIGPAVAGLVIAVMGIGPCFFVNAASYVVAVATLIAVDPKLMHTVKPQPRGKGQFREGLRYVWRTPDVLALLVLTALFMGLAWEYDVAVPLVARFTFHGGAGMYGFMSSAIGVGAIASGLVIARRASVSNATLVGAALALTVAMFAAALAPALWTEIAMLFFVGGGAAALASAVNSQIQLAAADEMRGRVMSLWAVAAVGMRPIGGPIVGYAGQHLGARASLAVGGIGVLLGLACWYAIRRAATPSPEPVKELVHDH